MSFSAIKEIEKSKTIIPPCVLPPPLLQEFFQSSLAKSASAPPEKISSKPRIPPPENTFWVNKVIRSEIKRERVLDGYFEYLSRAFEYENQKTDKMREKEAEKLKEQQQKEEEASSWGVYKRVFSYLSSAATLTIGISSAAGGAVGIGGCLIASGVSNIANDIMSEKEVGGWKKISQKITDDREKQESYASYMQTGTRFFSMLLGLAGLKSAGFLNKIPYVKKIAEIAKNTLAIASGITGIGSGLSESKNLEAKSKHLKIQNKVKKNEVTIADLNDLIRAQGQRSQENHKAIAAIVGAHQACLRIISSRN